MKGYSIKIMLVAGLVVLATACEKQPVVSGAMTITATVESDGTKAKIADADAKFSWSAGDKIAVYDKMLSQYSVSDALASGGSNSAVFSFSALSDADRGFYALYPSGLATTDYGNPDLKISLPDSYSIDPDDPEAVAVPMVAKNIPGGNLSFKHVCALIRLTVLNVPAGTSRLDISMPKTRISGGCYVLNLDSDPFEPYVGFDTAESGNVSFTLSAPTAAVRDIVLNIPVPPGDYSGESIEVTAKDNSLAVIRTWSVAAGSALSRAKGQKMTAAPEAFSVSESRKVIFAPGNLQAVTDNYGADWNWRFADSQYASLGESSGNTVLLSTGFGTTSTADAVVDLFGWSTDDADNRFGINAKTEADLYDGAFVDWGTNVIGSYAADTWSTLSKDEWQYVLMTRATGTLNGVENARFGKVVVNDVRGMVLFPDSYAHPSGVEPPQADHINVPAANYDGGGSYSVAEWKKMEMAGCVFLPVAGHRYTSDEKCQVEEAANLGEYWSNTSNSYIGTTKALAILFTGSSLSYMATPYRRDGYSVRLVREVK